MLIRTKSILAMSVICATPTLNAQEAGRIQAGQFDLIPSFTSSMAYVDNVANARDNQRKIYSWRTILSPELIAATQVDGNPVQIGYRLERGVYLSSDNDDYTDHFVEASGNFELNSRHRVSALAQYEDGHEDRGTGFSIGTGLDISTPDTYKSSNLSAEYSYGAVTSDGLITLKTRRQALDYDRSEDAYLIRDRVKTMVGGEFGYQVGSATRAVLDVTKTYVRYDEQLNFVTRDSDETRVLVGVVWESTAATTGFAKVGYKEKDFDNQARGTFYGMDWEVGIDWQPVSYTTFRISTSADTFETNGEGDFIRGQNYSVRWNHDWLERLSTSFSVTQQNDEYVFNEVDIDNRDDELMNYSAALNYQARRWLKFSTYYQFTDRDSNRETIGYDKSVVGVTAEVTL
ncbi:outer membrane beta-barrel protein [Alteromonas abrolhosensis]|uniref:outer membrane beta-barrel protein n=1 Tax=Alteromonas abrolhosensis TaxID=1892904 RepID=UPI00096BBDBC|nr:outer membrane beta-barrel protein [Alteromonas abrolhosensis]